MRIAPGDLVTWEVRYNDGSVDMERAGGRYGNIRRGCLSTFRLVAPDGVLIELSPPFNATGRSLVYRRRIEPMPPRRVTFVIGWLPMGPVILVDPAAGTFRHEQHFVEGDPDMYPPVLLPEEGAS